MAVASMKTYVRMNKDAALGKDTNNKCLQNSLQTKYSGINFFVDDFMEIA
jgi:hypothetical protein